MFRRTRRLFELVLLLSCALPRVAPAAQSEQKDVAETARTTSLGLQLGVNLSGARVSAGRADTALGLNFGIIAEAPFLGKLLYLQPELCFSQRGADTTLFGPPATLRLTYLELPVQAKLRFDVGRFQPFVLAGPRVGYLLDVSAGDAPFAVDRGRFASFDFGADLGAGIAVTLVNGQRLVLSAKASLGLVNISNSPVSWKNSGGELLAGLFL